MSMKQAKALFEDLWDADSTVVEQRLSAVSLEVREQVLRLLEADRGGGLPDAHELVHALAEDLVDEVSTVPVPWRPPGSLPGLQLLNEIGRGGMGIVFEARQLRPERSVAVKFLGPSNVSTTGEAQALAELSHPSIPTIFEVGEHEGVVFLVMERLKGESLERWAKGRPLADRLRAFLKICGAVSHAHRAGILHRDLKPSNMLAHGDRAWVLDFGLAQMSGASEGGVVGTLNYVADEVLDGEPASESSDVFSLGVTLTAVLGLPPPTQTSTGSLARQRRLRRERPVVQYQSGAPAPIQSIIIGCLGPKVERYPSVQALHDDIRAYLENRPVVRHAGRTGYRTGLWVRRRWKELAVLGVLTTACGLAAIPPWVEQRRVEDLEKAARLQLEPTRKAVVAALADGRIADAEALTDDVLRLPALRETRASAMLLGTLGVGLLDAGRQDEAARRLAAAYVASDDPRVRIDVTRGLIRILGARQEWSGVRLLAQQLPPAEAEQWNITARTALERYDADWPMLAQAQRFPTRASVVAGFEGGIQAVDVDLTSLSVIAPERTTTFPYPDSLGSSLWPVAVGDGEAVYWSARTADGDHVEVWVSDFDGVQLLARIPSQGKPTSATVADPDGDGRRTLYLGIGYPARALYGVDLASGDVCSPIPSFDKSPSDIDELLVASHDPDQLLLIRGPWEGFDMLTLDGEDDCALRVTKRERTGAQLRGGVVARPEGPVVVLRKTDAYPTPSILGDKTPHGMAAGVYAFRPTATGWQEAGRRSLWMQGWTSGTPVVADVDDDGWDDVWFGISDKSHVTRVQRLSAAGLLDAVWLANIVPLASIDFDRDGDDEVFVRVRDDDQHLWLLGAGDSRLPPVPAEPIQAFDQNVAADAWPLLNAGLWKEALPLLEAMAQITLDPDMKRERWRLVARVAEDVNEDRRAVDALTVVAAMGGVEDSSALREARARTHDFGTSKGEVQASLPAIDDVVLDFRGRLPSVGVVSPVPLTSTPRGVKMDVVGADGVLMRLPIERRGDHLALTASMEWDLAEIGAQLDVVLVDGEGRDVLGVGLRPYGGGRSVDRRVSCVGLLAQGTESSLAGIRPQHLRSEAIEARASHLDGTTRCDVDREAVQSESIWSVDLASTDDAVELQVRATSEFGYEASRLRATLAWIRLEGVDITDIEPGPYERWVMGDRSSLDDVALGPQRVAMAAAVGDVPFMREHAHQLGPEDWKGTLRRHPQPWLVAMADDPDALAARYVEAWSDAHLRASLQQLEHVFAQPLVDQFSLDVDGVDQMLFQRIQALLSVGEGARALTIVERMIREQGSEPLLETAKVRALELVGRHPEAHALCATLLDGTGVILDRIARDPLLQTACEEEGNNRFLDQTRLR